MFPPHVLLRHLQKTIQYGGKAEQKDEFKDKFLRLVITAINSDTEPFK
jgi:hypothetical protein